MYIIAAPALHQHHVVKNLIQNFSAQIYQDTPQGDFFLAVMAPTFIGSFGTYTWMAAFLSEGHSIHLPYISNLEHGSVWCPWKDLFIHDDPRVTYHDILYANSPTTESSRAVLARRTNFAQAVSKRKDPCPGL